MVGARQSTRPRRWSATKIAPPRLTWDVVSMAEAQQLFGVSQLHVGTSHAPSQPPSRQQRNSFIATNTISRGNGPRPPNHYDPRHTLATRRHHAASLLVPPTFHWRSVGGGGGARLADR
uniref:Uncharacterized protein n=1 Tax=Plectus sambesii TaxID=2011161 RepID=A0A914VG39_9BILA